MIWTAWNNGSYHESGAGYGFKVEKEDRDRHFDRSWDSVKLDLPVGDGVETVQVNVDKDSFWGDKCREVISKEIGQWLIKQGMAPWEKRKPPKLEVEVVGPGHFAVKGKAS